MVYAPISQRIRSIDTVRGAIMIIMALDHVRDYFHISALTEDPLNPATTSALLFFTRWITHFCAPSFLLLSGISAYLSSQKASVAEKSSFLIKRGLWLIVVEVVIMTFALSFDPTYKIIFLAVIWALGCSMIFLGILVRYLSARNILIVGLFLVFGHNLFDLIKIPPETTLDAILSILFTASGKFFPREDGGFIAVFYVILPWSGLMFAGYGLGTLFKTTVSPEIRRAALLRLGMGAMAIFLILRLLNGYGDPSGWSVQSAGWRTFLSFLNTSKYPPSLSYSLMTIGPVLIWLALTENADNWITRMVSIYGRVPFFFFVIHFYLIHLMTVAAFFATGHTVDQAADPKSIFLFRLADWGFNLWIVYGLWIFVVVVMYKPCRWFGDYKSRHKKWWLSYI